MRIYQPSTHEEKLNLSPGLVENNSVPYLAFPQSWYRDPADQLIKKFIAGNAVGFRFK